MENLEELASDVVAALNRSADRKDLAATNPIASESARPALEPIDPEATRQPSLVDELNRIAEGISIASRPTLPEDSPIPPTPSVGTSVIRVATTAYRPAPPSPPPDVAQAIRLTHDAIHAWMKIMARPTILQVSAP